MRKRIEKRKSNDGLIRMTIFVKPTVQQWMRQEKSNTGATYGDVVSKLVRSESKRRKNIK